MNPRYRGGIQGNRGRGRGGAESIRNATNSSTPPKESPQQSNTKRINNESDILKRILKLQIKVNSKNPNKGDGEVTSALTRLENDIGALLDKLTDSDDSKTKGVESVEKKAISTTDLFTAIDNVDNFQRKVSGDLTKCRKDLKLISGQCANIADEMGLITDYKADGLDIGSSTEKNLNLIGQHYKKFVAQLESLETTIAEYKDVQKSQQKVTTDLKQQMNKKDVKKQEPKQRETKGKLNNSKTQPEKSKSGDQTIKEAIAVIADCLLHQRDLMLHLQELDRTIQQYKDEYKPQEKSPKTGEDVKKDTQKPKQNQQTKKILNDKTQEQGAKFGVQTIQEAISVISDFKKHQRKLEYNLTKICHHTVNLRKIETHDFKAEVNETNYFDSKNKSTKSKEEAEKHRKDHKHDQHGTDIDKQMSEFDKSIEELRVWIHQAEKYMLHTTNTLAMANNYIQNFSTKGNFKLSSTDLSNATFDLEITQLVSTVESQILIQQEKAEKLQITVETLRKENNDLNSRLSKLAGDKLTDNNPSITNLGDPNRPMKISDDFLQLYDNEWTDAMEKLCTKIDNDAILKGLCDTLMTLYEICSDKSQLSIDKARGEFQKIFRDYLVDTAVQTQILKQYADGRKLSANFST